MKKLYRILGVIAIVIVIAVVMSLVIGNYKRNHMISGIVSTNDVEQIIVYDCFETYNPDERVAYELSESDYAKAIAALDTLCGKELFGPEIIGETIFIMDVSYKDGIGFKISVGENMLGLIEYTKEHGVTKKNIRHFAVKDLNTNILGQLFHANNVISGE